MIDIKKKKLPLMEIRFVLTATNVKTLKNALKSYKRATNVMSDLIQIIEYQERAQSER